MSGTANAGGGANKEKKQSPPPSRPALKRTRSGTVRMKPADVAALQAQNSVTRRISQHDVQVVDWRGRAPEQAKANVKAKKKS